MCGIVGAVSNRSVETVLLNGLKRLEYRGYDSAGIAILDGADQLQRKRTQGKVRELESALSLTPLSGHIGIAHTRWATHGAPQERNAHPHFSRDIIALVHNGIIENHEALRTRLIAEGYVCTSDTDSELVAHLIHHYTLSTSNFLAAVTKAVKELEGAFALGVLCQTEANRLIAVRQGSPLVIGIGNHPDEHFIASDHIALLDVANQFIYLEEGDIADITTQGVVIYDLEGKVVTRPVRTPDVHLDLTGKGHYAHYMLKEIYDQPAAVSATLDGRVGKDKVFDNIFGEKAHLLADVEHVQIVACGTSYHAGLVARTWIESLAGIPCFVDVASEYRYRKVIVPSKTLFVSISQSGETADTLAALRFAKEAGYHTTLSICNVAESSLVRSSDLVFMTRAGVEVGVASTKAFTTQLVALLLLSLVLGRHRGLSAEREAAIVKELKQLPAKITEVLALDETVQALAPQFADKAHALFLGRGVHYPVAMEAALKLKEISYIHAEAYPAGELKHGPLALVDKNMPVIAITPNDALLEKLKSNLHEVSARGGKLTIFADKRVFLTVADNMNLVSIPCLDNLFDPILFTIPLQLLAYHVALIKGTDVDQPRNLAKSVTVE